MKLLILIILIFSSLQYSLFSQLSFTQDTIISNNSETISLGFEIQNIDNKDEIVFDILVENPTVFYITQVESNLSISSSIVTPKGDGLFSIRLIAESDLSEFRLEGKLLSGSDSVSTIYLQNVMIGTYEIPTYTALIKNKFFDNSGVYVRFFESRPATPNPLYYGGTITIDFYNDLATNIEYILCDIRGYIYIREKEFFEKGKNQLNIDGDKLKSGVYYLYFFSEIGNSSEQIVVIK